MATTHTLADGDITVTVRGTPAPGDQYAYAAVVNLRGPLAVLLRRSAETAAKETLASHRAASWTWLDDDALSVRFTRESTEYAARVTADLLDRIEAEFATARARMDDDAFDAALDDAMDG